KELLVFITTAEAHDPLDACAVVPASIEQDHLAGGGQVRDVSLEIPLGPFAVVRRRQRRNATDAGIQALRDPLDHAALAGGAAPLEVDPEFLAGRDQPLLELDQLALEPEELAKVEFAKLFVLFRERPENGMDSISALLILQFDLQLFIYAVHQVVVD